MKKILIRIIIMVVIIMNLFTLNSCMDRAKGYVNEKMIEIIQTIRINREQQKFNDRKIAEENMEMFFTALNNSDKDAIKELFSEKALNDCGNADEQIDDLLSRFGGTIESWEYDCTYSGGHVEYGTYMKAEIGVSYYFKSNEKMYRTTMFIYPIDVEAPDNVGAYALYIIDDEKRNEMLEGKREIIKTDEMEKHPIIWIPDLPELDD